MINDVTSVQRKAMADFFIIRPARGRGAVSTGTLSGRASLVLPGISCPTCQAKWATYQVVRPDLPVPPELRTLKAFPVAPSEFKKITTAVTDGQDQASLPPGTWVGPISGRAKGTFGSVAWLGDAIPLWRKSVSEDLATRFEMPLFVPCDFTGLSGTPLSCPCLRLCGELTETSFEKRELPCEGCGRRDIQLKDSICLKNVEDNAEDIFRLAESPGVVVVSSRLHNFAIQSSWAGLEFIPLVVTA